MLTARKPEGRKLSRSLVKTPTSDAENTDNASSGSSSGPDWDLKYARLERQLSRLDTRVNKLEVFRLKSEKHRHNVSQRKLEYALRRSRTDDDDRSEDGPFKRPRGQNRKPPACPDMY